MRYSVQLRKSYGLKAPMAAHSYNNSAAAAPKLLIEYAISVP